MMIYVLLTLAWFVFNWPHFSLTCLSLKECCEMHHVDVLKFFASLLVRHFQTKKKHQVESSDSSSSLSSLTSTGQSKMSATIICVNTNTEKDESHQGGLLLLVEEHLHSAQVKTKPNHSICTMWVQGFVWNVSAAVRAFLEKHCLAGVLEISWNRKLDCVVGWGTNSRNQNGKNLCKQKVPNSLQKPTSKRQNDKHSHHWNSWSLLWTKMKWF